MLCQEQEMVDVQDRERADALVDEWSPPEDSALAVLPPGKDQFIARLQAAANALAAIETPADADAVARWAEAARAFARQARLGADAENAASAIRNKAGIRLAETVAAGQAAGEIASGSDASRFRTRTKTGSPMPHGGVDARGRARKPQSPRATGPTWQPPLTLKDLGISSQRMHEARVIAAAFTPADIDDMAEQATAQGEALSRAAVLRAAEAKAAQKVQDAYGGPVVTSPPAKVPAREAARTIRAVEGFFAEHGAALEVLVEFRDSPDLMSPVTGKPQRDYLIQALRGMARDAGRYADRLEGVES